MTWWSLPRKINRAKGQGVLLAEGATSCPGAPFRPLALPLYAQIGRIYMQPGRAFPANPHVACGRPVSCVCLPAEAASLTAIL